MKLDQSTEIRHIAYRDGNAATWEAPEHFYEVVARILRELNLDKDSDEIRQVAIAESHRQFGLFAAGWEAEEQAQRAENAYRSRMSDLAEQLVSALVAPGDRRDHTEVINAALELLRPVDKQLQAK